MTNAPRRGAFARGTLYLVAERGASAVIGLVVLLLISRTLGPEAFGRFGVAAGIGAVLTMIATVGLETHLTAQLTLHPAEALKRIVLAVLLHAAVLAALAAALIASLSWAERTDLRSLCFIFCGTALFNCAWAWECQLQARQRLLALSGLRFVSTLSLLVITLLLCTQGHPDENNFALAFLAQSGLRLLLAWRLCGRAATRIEDSGTWQQAWMDLAGAGRTLVLGVTAVAVYSQIDRFLLIWLVGASDTGVYLAAVRISEGLQFVPLVIASAYVPQLAQAMRDNNKMELALLQSLFDAVSGLALAMALLLCLGAPVIVHLLYGPAYEAAVPVLQVHAWSNLLAFLGVVSGRWMMVRGLHKLYLFRTLFGVAVHPLLTWILVHQEGVKGAAYAVLLSQVAVVFLSDLASTRTRPALHLKCRSLWPWRRILGSRVA